MKSTGDTGRFSAVWCCGLIRKINNQTWCTSAAIIANNGTTTVHCNSLKNMLIQGITLRYLVRSHSTLLYHRERSIQVTNGRKTWRNRARWRSDKASKINLPFAGLPSTRWRCWTECQAVDRKLPLHPRTRSISDELSTLDSDLINLRQSPASVFEHDMCDQEKDNSPGRRVGEVIKIRWNPILFSDWCSTSSLGMISMSATVWLR